MGSLLNRRIITIDIRPLRKLRERLGITQKGVAEKVGLVTQSYQAFENGTMGISLTNFRAIIEVLEADHLETLEILNYWPIDKRTIISFRAACKKVGVTPHRALLDFIKIFNKVHSKTGEQDED